MESLIILAIFWMIGAFIRKATKTASGKPGAASAQNRAGTAVRNARSTAAQPAGQPQRTVAEVTAEMLPPRRMQSTIQVSEHDHSGMFAGSLNADDSGEGRDIHDHGFTSEVDMPSMHSDEAINRSLQSAPADAQVPGLALSFDGNSVVRALVMQEILKRPCERTGR